MATHLLFLDEVEDDGRVLWKSQCLNKEDDPRRDCLLVAEPDRCDWHHWDNGDHRPECSNLAACEEKDLVDNEAWSCWEGEPIPDECDGVEHPELGHAHPIAGCALKEWLSDGGFGENVFFKRNISKPSYPVGVRITWDHFDGIELEESEA